jgi:hypothetical protein
MGSGAVIYVPIFIKIGSGVQKSIGGIHRHTNTHTLGQQRDLISLIYFFQNNESRLNKFVGNTNALPSNYNTTRSNLCREATTAHSQNHTKLIYILCGQNAECLIVKAGGI